MASLLPGYEYDIFISYRQKDNKGDRWVSELVDSKEYFFTGQIQNYLLSPAQFL